MTLYRTLAVGAATVAAVAGSAVVGSSAASAAGSSAAGGSIEKMCAAPAAGYVSCFAERRTDVAQPNASNPDAAPAGYGPADLKAAYKLGAGGAGQTVAIVDAMDDPNAESDLAKYRSTYGLPACTTKNGCFSKVNQNGKASPLPLPDSGWAAEISLDLDMVSAVCPSCHILLVEANTATIAALGKSVNTAVRLGAKYVSNSYGGDEDGNENTYDAKYYKHAGVAITASSGDNGYGASYPATGAGVTAVGGTSLTKAGNARGWTEKAWDGAGSGCSASVAKPAFQSGVATGCAKRAEADVSAVADPNTGVAVYDSFLSTGWSVYGGTSASSPIVAAVYALAGSPGSTPNADPYAHKGALFDVTSGSNGSCGKPLCTAGKGYDGPTGLGTPNGSSAFQG